MVHNVLLWLFVVFGGIAIGAGLYELRVNVPRWFAPAAASAIHVNVDAIRSDDSGRRFWAYVTTVPLTLLTLNGSTSVTAHYLEPPKLKQAARDCASDGLFTSEPSA